MMVEMTRIEPQKSLRFASDDPLLGTSEYARGRIASRSPVWRPPTDVYELEDALVVRVEIAGMREEDFSISLEDRTLSVRGLRSDLPERRAYHQMEIPFGEFISEVELPVPVKADGIEAVYRDGFLRILLPKVRPHSVKVEEEK